MLFLIQSLLHTKRIQNTTTNRKRNYCVIPQNKVYYIPFIENMKKIDLYFLFNLYDLAQFNDETKVYDTIHYTSQSNLALQLGISLSQLKRIISNKAYSNYFFVNTIEKTITLYNDFRNSNRQKEKMPFVSLSAEEIRVLRENEKNNELLPKYYVYLKYYCGFNVKSHSTDSTAKQILSAIGYSTNSSYQALLSSYNQILTKNKLIRITQYRDEKKQIRNRYAII